KRAERPDERHGPATDDQPGFQQGPGPCPGPTRVPADAWLRIEISARRGGRSHHRGPKSAAAKGRGSRLHLPVPGDRWSPERRVEMKRPHAGRVPAWGLDGVEHGGP